MFGFLLLCGLLRSRILIVLLGIGAAVWLVSNYLWIVIAAGLVAVFAVAVSAVNR